MKPKSIRFTDEEYEKWEKEAQLLGITFSDFIKQGRHISPNAPSDPVGSAPPAPDISRPWPYNDNNEAECMHGYRKIAGWANGSLTYGATELCEYALNRPKEMISLELSELYKVCKSCQIWQKNQIALAGLKAQISTEAKISALKKHRENLPSQPSITYRESSNARTESVKIGEDDPYRKIGWNPGSYSAWKLMRRTQTFGENQK